MASLRANDSLNAQRSQPAELGFVERVVFACGADLHRALQVLLGLLAVAERGKLAASQYSNSWW